MKKPYLKAGLILTLGVSILSTSCIGSFALTNKLMTWNKGVSNKFVNELIFFAFWVLPVYEVTALADVIVLNSIEFWSGENPVAAGTKVIEGNDGRYLVEADETGYTITSENDGSIVRLDFTPETQTWSVTANDVTTPLFSFIDDSHISIIGADGSYRTVELDARGVMAYQNEIIEASLAAR
ncbi:MAG: DUF3332 domain-containing protein [Muribaculaceae bacterium]|nr:DUF3332 domain-containing protein [Muribaculaceae bacterium]